MVSEEDIIILLATLWISHQTHGAGLGTKILNNANMFFHKVIHDFLGQRKILAQDMYSAVWIYKTLGYQYYSFVFLAHIYPLHYSRVIRPVYYGLLLFGPAFHVTGATMLIYLRYVPLDRLPPYYLTVVFFTQAPSHVITTIPLKPTARIIRIYPSFFTPVPERLAGIDLEII